MKQTRKKHSPAFKSRTPTSGSLEIPANSLLASAFFAVPIFAQTQPIPVEDVFLVQEFAYIDPEGDGIWTAHITLPVVEGEYEIITLIEYQDPETGARAIRLTTVIDPEGYIYRRIGNEEARIPQATVSLYWWNEQTSQYQLWPAQDFQQENPQVTDVTDRYSFLVPAGSYYLEVEARGYLPYQGETFQVREGSPVHSNIELKTSYWWLTIIDWRTAVLVGVALLLLLYFWRDRVRKRNNTA